MENILPPAGTRVTYTCAQLGTMEGTLIRGDVGYNEDPVMFLADEKYHARIEAAGYEPAEGLFTTGQHGPAPTITRL